MRRRGSSARSSAASSATSSPRSTRSPRGLPVLDALDEFGACLRRQVDMRVEAAANRRLRAALAREPAVLLPALVERYCSESLLTMELLPVDRGRRDPSRRPALLAALRALYRMIFLEGFVHCDLHGANLFLLPDGRAAMVDFGFTAELPAEVRLQFAEFFLAMAMDGWPGAELRLELHGGDEIAVGSTRWNGRQVVACEVFRFRDDAAWTTENVL